MTLDRFKLCNGCMKWLSVEDVLFDPVMYPIGMAAHGRELNSLFFYFVHHSPTCMSTNLVSATLLSPYVGEPIPPRNFMGGPSCPGYCGELNDRRECDLPCMLSAYRRFFKTLQTNRQRQTVADLL